MRMFFMVLLSLVLPSVTSAQVREVWATTGDPDFPFGRVTSVVEKAGGLIWVMDAIGSRHIHELTSDGDFVRTIGRHGDGPGELRNATIAATTPEGGVTIMSGRLADTFGPNGEYQDRIRLPFLVWNPKGMAVVGDQLYLSGARQKTEFSATSTSVFSFDRETGRPGPTMHPSQTTAVSGTRNALYVSGGPLEVTESTILVADAAPFRLMEYPVAGGEGRLIAQDLDLVPAIVDEFTYLSPHRTPSGGILYAHRWDYARVFFVHRVADHYLVVARYVDEEFDGPQRTIFNTYSRQGNLLSSFELPTAYEIFSVASNGDLLGVRWNDLGESVAVRLRMVTQR